ncbi:MAG: formyltransferase family protein [Wolinella sp.]
MNSIGLITYNHTHLKTEQIIEELVFAGYDFKYAMYLIPFTLRTEREVLFAHRPAQTNAAHPAELAKSLRAEVVECSSAEEIPSDCDLYLICGAGVLSKEVVKNKKILNLHAGIVPMSRGLDSFKWAIYHGNQVGNTMHFIDESIDAGEIIAIEPTPVYPSDTLESFARRHYEREILMIGRFPHYIERYTKNRPKYKYPTNEPTRRMSRECEEQLKKRFIQYKNKFAL